MNFANKILKNHIDLIDIYGNGYNPIDDKLEVLSKYKYVLAIENGLVWIIGRKNWLIHI